MKQLLSDRTASLLIVLTERPAGLRLADLARLIGAPLSSTQRVVESLLDDGVVIRDGASRPRYRIAPEVPAGALAQLAGWKLPPARVGELRQSTAAMDAYGAYAEPSRVDLDTRLRDAMSRPGVAARLRDMAERLVWWQRPERTLRRPAKLIAQAMSIGTDEDAATVETVFGVEALRQVLATAPPGVFDARRWDHWHLRFGYRRTPPLPTRLT